MCSANRIGHGVAIVEDIKRNESGAPQLGDFAAYVRNERICLEMCLLQRADGRGRLHRRAPDCPPGRSGFSGNREHRQSVDERDDVDS